jgi:hypothetical protein
LPGDGDAVLCGAELAGEIDPTADVEDDRAAASRSVLDAVTQTSDAAVGEIGDVVNVAAATAESRGSEAFGLGERFDLGADGSGEQ